MFSLVCSLIVLASCDFGELLSKPEAWETTATDFTVEHQEDGFVFASQKRDIVNCLRKGGCTWHGLEVWEARLYFGVDALKKVELSLYNRGDDREAGGLSATELKDLLDAIALKAQPSGKIGANPAKVKNRLGGFQYSKSFDKGDTLVDLAWGVNGAKVQSQSADYVRVTLRPKPAKRKPKGATKSVSGNAAKAKVKAHVKSNSDGDTWIGDVPMVDQGQKGYCAAATAERVLRYYGIEIDEHEIAQEAGTTARGGTSIAEMIETVRIVGSKHHLGFQAVVSLAGSLEDIEKEIVQYNKAAKGEGVPELRMSDYMRGNIIMVGEIHAAMRPKVVKKMRLKDPRFKKFMTGVKTQADQGVPLFWGVTLGLYPEPEIPQASGGHMRLIIGYNEKTHEILYTDTWGAGHELKRMPADWAFAITHDLFFLKPL